MKQQIFATLVAVAVCSSVVAVRAHPVTLKGTVVSAVPTIIKVTVIDEKTKKPVVIAFEIDKETKILRGDVVVTFAQANIQKGEQIAVTVNLDNSETLADVVRLDTKK